MRASLLTLLAALAVTTAPPTAFARVQVECGPDSGFGPTDPTYYACQESNSPDPLDDCYRYGVRPFGGGAEGRFCLRRP